MNRCPRGQRRIEGKCVYKDMYEDCQLVARSYNKGMNKRLKETIDFMLWSYALDKETAGERARDSKIYKKKKVRWDDVYFVMLGAGGEGW